MLVVFGLLALATASHDTSMASSPLPPCESHDESCDSLDGGMSLLQTKVELRLGSPGAARVSLEPPTLRIPRGFVKQGSTPATQKIELSFLVKHQNVDKLHERLLQVSDPFSPDYGKHLKNEEVQELVAPKSEHIEAVLSFLKGYNVLGQRRTINGDVITATVEASLAEEMLSAKYEAFSHTKSGRTMHRCLGGYALPPHVAAAIDLVSPTVHLMSPPPPPAALAQKEGPGEKQRKDPNKPPSDLTTASPTTTLTYNNEAVCPEDPPPTTPKALRTLYSVSGTTGQNPNTKQAVTGFIGQTYNLQNLRDYWTLYCAGILCGKGDPGDVGDDTTKGYPGVEAMLDIDVITGVAGNIYTEFWGFEHLAPENDPFLKWLVEVGGTSDEVVPKVFSTSYGEDENSYSRSMAERLDTEFMKMGARGISIFFASGDEGANVEDGVFQPESPASSPYVTAVGATAPTRNFPTPGSETATALSSGGFSNIFAMPKWQKDAVKLYLEQNGLPNTTKYHVNTSGRAYPDISAQGYSYCVTPHFVTGVEGCAIGGTSAASPASAAIFSLLNDLRAGLGKGPLGFLNPLIYAHPDAFHDITVGYNTMTGSCSSAPAWPATVGWDATTGVGTPNYARLAEIVTALP